jgi:hypothetical protein
MFFEWEQEILDHGNVVDAREIHDVQNKIILATSFTDLKEMFDHPVRKQVAVLSIPHQNLSTRNKNWNTISSSTSFGSSLSLGHV